MAGTLNYKSLFIRLVASIVVRKMLQGVSFFDALNEIFFRLFDYPDNLEMITKFYDEVEKSKNAWEYLWAVEKQDDFRKEFVQKIEDFFLEKFEKKKTKTKLNHIENALKKIGLNDEEIENFLKKL